MKKEKDKNHLCFHYEAEEEVKPHKIACYLSLKNTGDRNSNKKNCVKSKKNFFFGGHSSFHYEARGRIFIERFLSLPLEILDIIEKCKRETCSSRQNGKLWSPTFFEISLLQYSRERNEQSKF